MKLKLSIEGKNEIEQFILLLNLGLATALKEEVISLEEVENSFFNPYSMKKLEELGISESVTELIHLGCELEDVKSLVPEKFGINIESIQNKVIEQLKNYSNEPDLIKKWIDA